MPFKTILKSIGGTIRTVTEFVEDEVIDRISNEVEYGVDEFRQGNPAPVLNAMSLGMSGAMAPLTQAVRGVDETEGTLLESAGNFVEDKTGIPSLVTQVAAGTLIPGPGEYKAAGKSIARGVKKAFPLEGVDNIFPPTPPTALATAGATPRMQLNVSGGKANLAPQVMDLTIKDPALVATGIKKGSAKSPEWIEQTRDFDRRRAAARERVVSATGKSAKKNSISAMYNEVSTGPTRKPGLAPAGDPHAYTDEAFKRRSVIEKLKDGSPKWKEQHHLFSKQESYQFVEKMIELGDDDDVLSMFLFAEDLDATMGGRLSNMLNMERKPHSLLHTSRKRKIDGRELKADEMQNLVNSAKTSTELMALFNKYVTENVLVSIDEAKAFNEISNRMIRNNKYGFIQELYDKNMLRAPVWRDY